VQYSLLKLSIFTFLLLMNLVLALFISYTYIDNPGNHYLLKYLWMVPVYLLFYAYYRLLSKRMVMSMEFTYIEKANFLALIVISLIIFASRSSEHYSRSVVLLFFLMNVLITPVGVYLLKRRFMRNDLFREDIMIICDKEGEEDVNSWFVQDNSFGFNVASKIMVDGMSDDEVQERIKYLTDSYDHYAVVVSLAGQETDKAFQTVSYVLHRVSRGYVIPQLSKLPLINSEFFNSINHKGMALYVKNKLLHEGERNIKAIFDKVLSITLFILFLPIILILYVIVYISTKGDPVYKQRRIGKDGKSFHIYKFRTMHADADKMLEEMLENDPELKAEWQREFKLKDDPRITRVGKFLRRTSLDELPQLYNVFQGKMSLVGPRPIIADEIPKYGEYFKYFTAVKPGITGLWQVSGRNDISYEERVRLDVWYVRNWSLELDIMILVKTAAIVLLRRGSY
jgi:undecaprenyl-phosphate galactose phosphotransferase